jgi:hypothetical protein
MITPRKLWRSTHKMVHGTVKYAPKVGVALGSLAMLTGQVELEPVIAEGTLQVTAGALAADKGMKGVEAIPKIFK